MAKIKLRRDTYQNWYNANPVLALGEPSFDTTNRAFKVGDGTTTWQNLRYTTGIDTTKLPLSGGTLTGGLTGTNAIFSSISAVKLFGDGSGLTGITGGGTTGNFLSANGGTLTGGLTGTNATFRLLSAAKFYGDGSNLTGVTSQASTGDITWSGVQMIGAGSAGANGNATIELVPDSTAYDITTGSGYGIGGRYLIIDPTVPDHIHIRAGGPMDEAASQLILGGEKANITVRDQANNFTENHHVIINSEDNDGNHHSWTFGPSGNIVFPTLGVDLHNGGLQTGQVLQFGDPYQQAIITGPTPATNSSAQRLIIQGQKATGSGEGGDVYLWGGDSQNNGGDIKIYAGDADSLDSGSGGYVNIDGGRGYNFGGHITIDAGYSQEIGGDVTIQAGQGDATGGGNVAIWGGASPQGVGGNVTLNAGYGLTESGYVRLQTDGTHQLTLDKTGGTTFPGKIIASSVAKNAGSNTNSIAIDLAKQINKIKPWGNGGLGPITGDQYTLADGVEGQVLHLVPQSGYNSGDEYTTVKIAHARYKEASTGNILQAGEISWWLPFGGVVTNAGERGGAYGCLVTLIFTDGYWNLPHSIFGSAS